MHYWIYESGIAICKKCCISQYLTFIYLIEEFGKVYDNKNFIQFFENLEGDFGEKVECIIEAHVKCLSDEEIIIKDIIK